LTFDAGGFVSDHAEDLDKRVRSYVLVGASLLILTGLTVAVAEYHLPVKWAVTVALCIAAFKGSLVAGVFMHLISERKLIYGVLLLTVVFFLALLFGPTLTHLDGYGT
jgi:caa(3)-type oxidase subunit IV